MTTRALIPLILACPLWGQAPQPGQAVDLASWAYSYRKGAADNPPETQWLWPHQTLRWDVKEAGRDIWYYDDSSPALPQGVVLAALLWEEPRDVRTVAVEFPGGGGHVPKSGEVLVACRSAGSMWDDRRPTASYTALVAEQDGRPLLTPQGTTVFRFTLVCDPFLKLYAVYTGGDRKIGIPVLHAYGKARWRAESEVDVQAGDNWKAKVDAYNGTIAGVDPVPGGLRLRVFQTDDAGTSRTLATFWTNRGNFTVALRELDAGPVVIPSMGVALQKPHREAGSRPSAALPARNGPQTTRQRVADQPEESWAGAMQRYYPGVTLPRFPEPPYEPAMKIDVPEKELVNQWRLGAWHLERWCQRQPDGSTVMGIWWPFQKGIAANEGMTALGQESYAIIRALDLLGAPAKAESGLNYWLFGPHARPFVWFAKAMGDDALVNPYNGPNRRCPGYDQKHAIGHGRIMATAAFHYRLTRNEAWWEKAAPVLERAAAATLRLREQWDRTQPAEAWSHGLMPPGNVSDLNGTRLFYALSGTYCEGLRAVENLRRNRADDAVVRDLRKALDRSIALTQVVKVNDGTYRRALSYMPYIRGMNPDVTPEDRYAQYYERSLGSLTLVGNGVLDPRDTIVGELLDIYEDRTIQDGQNGQSAYNPAPMIYLARDEIPMFLRGLYNGYGAEINLARGYAFFEGARRGHGADDKPVEEAAFLERVRMMLVMEENNALWLARGTPRAWLQQGRRIAIAHAPTFFGEVSYSLVSDVEHGAINAVIDLPSRELPAAVFLRLRHPGGEKIRSVQINGRPWSDFDPALERIVLKGLTGRVSVSARYR